MKNRRVFQLLVSFMEYGLLSIYVLVHRIVFRRTVVAWKINAIAFYIESGLFKTANNRKTNEWKTRVKLRKSMRRAVRSFNKIIKGRGRLILKYWVKNDT